MTRKFLLLTLLISATAFAQYEYRDSNRIGISFGINQFTLNTNDFQTKPGQGWNGGLSMRGNFYNDWDMVYAIQFSENNFDVATNSGFITNKEVNLKLPSAQISLMLSYKFIENHLSVEFGPVVQFGGKLTTEKGTENNEITGTDLLVKDITNVSKFNFYPAIGITAGGKHIRLNVSYQYGITNLLGNIDGNYKGNASIINGSLILYL